MLAVEHNPAAQPLTDVRVLEIGGGIAAAFTTRLLMGYGAQVLRSESDTRVPLTADEEIYLLAGKQRIDVSSPQLRALALAADIVVEDRGPGELATLGLDPVELRRERPELVIVSLSPFGQSGPYATYQSTNAVSFAMGGIMSLTGDLDHTPLLSGGSQAEFLGGYNGFAAALTAYFGRLIQGEGDWIDSSLQEAAASMVELYVVGTSYGMPVQLRMGNHVRAIWGVYPCADGWAGAFCLERQVPGLFACLADPELEEPRFREALQRLEPQNSEEMTAKMYGFFAGVTKADLLELGPRYRVPFGVVLTPKDLLSSGGLVERGFFDELNMSGEAGPLRMPGRPFPGFGWSAASKLSEPGADSGAALAAWGVSV